MVLIIAVVAVVLAFALAGIIAVAIVAKVTIEEGFRYPW